MTIKRFVDDCDTKYDDFTLSLSAGYIDEEGAICNEQMGAKDTFSIGMPVYAEDGNEIGRLSIGLLRNLNYYSRTEDALKIPVEYWRVDGYTGDVQNIKTYHQVRAELAAPAVPKTDMEVK